MYSIYAGNECIYSDRYSVSERIITDGTLVLEDNSSGSLEIVLPSRNAGYSSIIRMKTLISVKRNGKDIFQGRVLSETSDFYNNRTLHCEGALGFLNDSVQTKVTYSATSIADILESMLTIHNSQVDDDKKILLGECEFDLDIDFETDFRTTMDYLGDLIDALGAHVRIRYENENRYLDCFADYPNISSQSIDFGRNLLDFTSSYDLSELVTVLIPLGVSTNSDGDRLTVASVNGGSIYVESPDAIEAYGRIIKTAVWDKIDNPDVLLATARQYLSEGQFDAISLEVSAIDLSLITKKKKTEVDELVYSGTTGGYIVLYQPSTSIYLVNPGDTVTIHWHMNEEVTTGQYVLYQYIYDETTGTSYVQEDPILQAGGPLDGTKTFTTSTAATYIMLLRQGPYYDEHFDVYVKKSIEVGEEPIDILDYVNVVSKPHGLDSYFPVTRLEIPLLNPENTKFTLNQSVNVTLTEAYNGTAKAASETAVNVINASKRVSEVHRISSNHFTVTVVNSNGTEPVTNTFNIETDTSGNTVFHNTTNNTTITFKGW